VFIYDTFIGNLSYSKVGNDKEVGQKGTSQVWKSSWTAMVNIEFLKSAPVGCMGLVE
jgi:hypothetical protein